MNDVTLHNEQVLTEIKTALNQINNKEIELMLEMIISNKHIFLAGAGRSLLMLKCFGMRLMQLGFTVYMIGDVTTPAITADDLLIIASGSGETESMVNIATKAQRLFVKTILITSKAHSTIAILVDRVVVIPTVSLNSNDQIAKLSIQPGASLFEQCSLILFDSIILTYITDQKKDRDSIMLLHANLE